MGGDEERNQEQDGSPNDMTLAWGGFLHSHSCLFLNGFRLADEVHNPRIAFITYP